MGWRIAADVVLITHLAFVVLVVVGGFFAIRWRWVALVHVPAAVYGAVIQLWGFTCPLTPLEKWLRRQARGTGYEGGFVEHYIVGLLYPGEFTLTVRIVLAVLVVAVNLAAYTLVWRAHGRNRKNVST